MNIEQALVISLITLFLHACSWEGMIFERVKDVIKPEGMLYKPIYGCPICMAPWWGSGLYWLFYAYTWQDWLLTIGAAAGFSVLWVCMLSIRDAAVEIEDKLKK